jgi:hypothetical protein
VVCVAEISLKNTNNEYIKSILFEAQAANSNLRYAETFTPAHYKSSIELFYAKFSLLYDCTKLLIKKNLLPEGIVDEDKLPADIKIQYQIIKNTDHWFTISTIDRMNISNGKKYFDEYSWLVVSNLF